MNEALLRAYCALANRVYDVRASERGAGAIEYGIIVALIAAIIVAILRDLGTDTKGALRSGNRGL